MSDNMKIITTVGTSIFTNYQDKRVADTLGRDYVSIDKALEVTRLQKDGSDVPASGIYEEEFQPHIKRLKEVIQDLWYAYPEDKPNTNASAEIASILKIAAQEEAPCEVHLIATDTLQSVLAAELIVGWFEQFPQSNIQKVLFQRQGSEFDSQKSNDYIVKDLRVSAYKDYDKGFFNLFDLLSRILKSSQENIIFNITGGYKAIIPIMTLYAQIERIPLKYIYEGNVHQDDALITLDYVPFHYDWGLLELLADYIEDKDLRERLPEDSKILDTLRKYKIIRRDSRDLTILGSLIEKFTNTRLWEGKTSFGYFAEYKVYEAVIEQFNEKTTRGVEYWWDLTDKNKFSNVPKYNKDESKEIRVEFDLISEINEKKIWYEVKPFSRNSLNKAYKQIQQKIEFNKHALNEHISKFRLVLYKFDFEELKNGQQIIKIHEFFKSNNIDFELWYFDIPVKFDAQKIDNKGFFERKIELKRYDI